MAEDTGAEGSRTLRVAAVIVVLLAIAVAVNWSSIEMLVSGERTLKQIVHGRVNKPEEQLGEWTAPDPMGAEDAKVTVEVFLASGDPCHTGSYCLGKALGKIDPDRIRVVFRDISTEEGNRRFADMEFACMQGLAVNGKKEFAVPGEGAGGESGETENITTDTVGGWSMANLHYILDQALKEAYGEGLDMTPSELAESVAASEEACMDELRLKAELKQDAET